MNEESIQKINPTNCALITKRMENVHRIHVSLFTPPDKVYPSRKVLADIAAFKCLFTRQGRHQSEEIFDDEAHTSMNYNEQERVSFCPRR